LCQFESDFSYISVESAEDTAPVGNYAEFLNQQKRYQKLIASKKSSSIAKNTKLVLKAADVLPA